MKATHGINMATLKMVRIKRNPSQRRTWYYQHQGEEIQELSKDGKYWYFREPIKNGGCEIGSDTLSGAKDDLKYYGAKVWSELK